ncbi:MAG: type VI secretion system contractile sheath large subunit [Phycisphaerae bacterium]|jgi:type VI secretion system protein ImpC
MSDEPIVPDLEVEFAGHGSGLRVTTDMPYRILVVGDFAGGETGTVSGSLGDGPVEISADSFDEVMAGAGVSLRLKTTHPFLPGNQALELDVRFDSLKAFEPAGLIAQLPQPRLLSAVRAQLVERLGGRLSADKLTAAVGRAVGEDATLSWLVDALKWSPSAQPADPGAVNEVLGGLDLGESEETPPAAPPRSATGALVSSLAAGAAPVPSEEASAIRRALGEIDRRLTTWLTAVLHAAPVQAAEAAWRSLAFLVAHIEFRKGIRLSVLHAKKSDLLERFRTRIIDPVFDAGMASPDLIVVDAAFANTAPDLEALDELAQHAASLPAVLLTGVSPAFFGAKFAWQVPTLPGIATALEQYQFAKWRSLRDQAYARSLGVVFGRGLLRGLYDRREASELEFAYREEAVGEGEFVWCGGAMAAACSVARSLADTGWPSACAGYVNGQIDGFTSTQGGKKREKKFGPTDTLLPEPKIAELAVAGVNALSALQGSETALLWNGLTAARVHRDDHIGLLEVSLPYQLFASRLAVLLFALKPHLAGLSAEKIIATVTEHVRDWLKTPDGPPPAESVSVLARPAEDAPAVLELAVTATPPQNLLPGGIPVVMGYRIG